LTFLFFPIHFASFFFSFEVSFLVFHVSSFFCIFSSLKIIRISNWGEHYIYVCVIILGSSSFSHFRSRVMSYSAYMSLIFGSRAVVFPLAVPPAIPMTNGCTRFKQARLLNEVKLCSISASETWGIKKYWGYRQIV
jgi:hypothetical protein